jgi:dynein heavy chain
MRADEKLTGGKPMKFVKAKGLWKDRDALCYWRNILVTRYFPKSRRYEGFWEHTNQKAKLPRIYILFDEEDPRRFVKRFKHAYENRVYADSLIKYNYYVENMPIHEIPELDHEKINRILILTQNTKALRGKSSADTSLLNEINFEFCKSMNNIIFTKHLSEKGKGNGLITGSLKLPKEPPKKQAPYFGMITIPEHDYPETFSTFCSNTLLFKNEVIMALNEIKKECNDVMTRDIFNNSNINKSMRIEDFKQIQNSSISQTSYYLRETWVNKIKDIIKGNFNDMGEGWFNLGETNKEIYEAGKLKKFLTQVKFIMQDTLLHLTRRSVLGFVEAILKFLPLSVDIIDANNVVNKFITDEEQAKLDEDPFSVPKDPIPLFTIDLVLEDGTNELQYSVDPGDVVSTIMQIFDAGIETLQEITQIEQKLLPHLFKSNNKMFLKATKRPRQEPEKIDPKDMKALPDENEWVWDSYMKLRSEVMKAIYPMDDYISCNYFQTLK